MQTVFPLNGKKVRIRKKHVRRIRSYNLSMNKSPSVFANFFGLLQFCWQNF